MDPLRSLPDPLPLSGRGRELEHLRDVLDQSATGGGTSVFLRGEGGVGKSRLVETVAEDARRRGWTVAFGRAYPVGTGAPFDAFQDAFVPLLRAIEPETLTVLTRGTEAELGQLFPALGAGAPLQPHEGSPSEQKMRLFWNFAEFLEALAARQPLLLVLEDVQWADESSMELLHFAVRQLVSAPVQILATYNDQYRSDAPQLVATEQSLEQLKLLEILRLQPLTQDDLADLAAQVFVVDRALVVEFAARLHDWTAGNSFFAVETIRALVESGQITRTEGTWVGFDTPTMKLPQSIRESVVARTVGMTGTAEQVARVSAVLGARVRYSVLRSAVGIPEEDLLSGIDELRGRRILVEREDDEELFVDFSHPLVRETLHNELGHARARALHGQVAVALERHYGDAAPEHADELAYHFGRADDDASTAKVVAYLAAAGRRAFGRYAHGPSVDHLEAAVTRLDALPPEERQALEDELGPIREDCAWACHAVGRVEEAIGLLEDLLVDSTDPERRGLTLYRLARALYWAGRYRQSLERVNEALALSGNDVEGRSAALLLLRGHCLEQMGRSEDARAAFGAVLESAVASGDAVLEARAHQAHALLSLWVGRMEDVESHADRALGLARSSGASTVEFWSLWVQAAHAGLTGHLRAVHEFAEQASTVAKRIRAPHLRVWSAELLVEHAAATGDWKSGITIGEQAIALAQSLGQRTLLPRLQVWTGLIHLHRGDERGRTLVEEAWQQAVEGIPPDEIDVHAYVPAHIGRAAYLIATEDFDGAIEVAERALEVSEDSGYFIWAIHRLLPTLVEALILKGDVEGARVVGGRLRRDAERAGHRLGLAWADACDALVAWLSGNVEASLGLFRQAAEALEAVPFPWDAARIRRQLAGRLVEQGLVDEATAELREVHEVFSRLGAESELDKTRRMFDEIGARKPARKVSTGAGLSALTAREWDIAKLVERRMSNKRIAKELEIAPRTASTHLSNIFKKTGVSSRGELVDLMRKHMPPDERSSGGS